MRSFVSLTTVLLAGVSSVVAAPAPTTTTSLVPRYEGTKEIEAAILKARGGKDQQEQVPLLGAITGCAYAELFFGENNILMTDPNYEGTGKTGYWSRTSLKKPACMISPGNPREVSIAMGIAKLSGTPFAVKSGGHNMNPGWSNIDQGILIKMDRFKQVEYDAAAGAVHVGPGNLWKDVVMQLAPYNVTIVGGRVPGVGVGGLLLGGGLSYLSNKYGMAADNVLNYELVSASGNIINANATHNSDLFWALKGGSTNYGIVTKYTLRAIPLGPVYSAIISYGPEKTDEVMQAYAEYQKNGVNDTDSNVLLQITSDPGYATLLNIVYLKPVWKPEVFAPFYKIQSRFDTSAIMSFAQYILMQEQDFGGIQRWQLRGTSYKASLAMDRKVVEIATKEFTKPVTTMGTKGATILIFQPVAPSVVKAGNQRNNGGNPLGIQSVGQTWFSTCAGWDDAKRDEFVYAAAKKTTDLIEKESKKKGLYLNFIFMNDAFKDQNVFASYGSKNFEKMKQIAKKYDPEGVFQTLWQGGFKLFQAWCACQQ